MSPMGWFFSPDSGGVKVPKAVQRQTEERIRRCAEREFAGCYSRLDIRFRGQFCYIDAYQEPKPNDADWLPPGSSETREEHLERLRNTPVHLCRLRYFGSEARWGYAFYSYGSNRYELSAFPDGDFLGKAEEAFRLSASVYLNEP